jgi:hypothetical protein
MTNLHPLNDSSSVPVTEPVNTGTINHVPARFFRSPLPGPITPGTSRMTS